jgi:hypothetical protein
LNEIEASEVQEASISITKAIERAGGMSSNIYQQGHATKCEFEFSCKLGYSDKTYQELFLGGTSPSATSDPTVWEFKINAHNGVTLGSGRRELSITLANCIAKSFTKPAGVGGLIFLEISGNGTLDECFSVDNIASGSW